MTTEPLPVQTGTQAAPDISVVMCIGEHVPELRTTLEQFRAEFERRGKTAEFVVVLDGVSDQVYQEAYASRPPGANVRLVRLNHPFGESIAQLAGFRIARGAVIMTMPPYTQIEPSDVQRVLDALDDGLDLVAGFRHPRTDPRVNRMQSALFNLVMRSFTGVPLHDMNCPLRAMKRKVVEDVHIQGDMMRFLPVLAHRHGFRVGEVRVRHLKERGSTGFFGIGVYARRFLDVIALLFLSKFTRAPLRFFGMAGIISFLVGFLICCWLTLDYLAFSGEPLRNKVSLLLGVMLMVLGMQVFSIGLVGEIIIFTQAKNLKEYRLYEEAEEAARTRRLRGRGTNGSGDAK